MFGAVAIAPLGAADRDNSQRSKPLVVMIFDKNCKAWCGQVRPMIADLQKGYGDDVEFAEIDVTTPVLSDAKKKAKELGIGDLLEDAVAYVPLVIICESNRKKHNEFVGPKSKEVYEAYLKKVLAKRG
jgi:hypothetical protein